MRNKLTWLQTANIIWRWFSSVRSYADKERIRRLSLRLIDQNAEYRGGMRLTHLMTDKWRELHLYALLGGDDYPRPKIIEYTYEELYG